MVFRSDDWQRELDKKIDRLLNDVEFIKNRSATYLGRNEALTYLADETPIFVNTDDFGGPLNFLNGGRYEEEYFSVLLSYRRPGSVFLDIGANLGVYSLRLATTLRSSRILAFEPIPRIRALFSRSAFLNGFSNTISILPYALSDHDGEAVLGVPEGHTGGASLEIDADTLGSEVVQLRRLDDLMGEDFVCHLVKIDVEGHELHVLGGARQTMQRSPDCVVMFEKLAQDSGIEQGMLEYADALGWGIYGIEGVFLGRVDLDAFRRKGGYFIAGRRQVIEDGGMQRNFFSIYPGDLNVILGESRGGVLRAKAYGPRGSVVFHGPYWFLPRGYYRLAFEGEIEGEFDLDLAERFGFKVVGTRLSARALTVDFPVYRDLCKFEVVVRTVDERSVLSMNSIRVTRLG